MDINKNSNWENKTNYTEGIDFEVQLEKSEWQLYFYFYTLEWELIWYIKAFYEEIKDCGSRFKRWYIVDTISAHKIEQNAPRFVDMFKKRWYIGCGLRDFWSSMYEVVLEYLREKHWNNILVHVNSHEKNIPQVKRLIQKVEERTYNLIRLSRWWDDWNAALIYLEDID